jgi:hypothetical protein
MTLLSHERGGHPPALLPGQGDQRMGWTITCDRNGNPDGGVREAEDGDHCVYDTREKAIKWAGLLAEDHRDRVRRGCRGVELLY